MVCILARSADMLPLFEAGTVAQLSLVLCIIRYLYLRVWSWPAC